MHPNICDGWFRETNTLWPGQQMGIQVSEVLFHERGMQDVLVFQSPRHGNVLVLDGVIQCAENDEFAYQEMIAHIPLNAHANPKKVLVIGGGDGGVLREIVKHECVEHVTLVEIDKMVPFVAKKYLPAMAVGFSHPKVTVEITDGFEYLKNHPHEFDVIITDSSDPIGPAASLFGKSYYQLMHQALLPGGIVCTQGESMWLHMDLIKGVMKSARETYKSVSYAWASVPTYPSGQIGFILCSDDENVDFSVPKRRFSVQDEKAKCRYYHSRVHAASFVLPQFAASALA